MIIIIIDYRCHDDHDDSDNDVGDNVVVDVHLQELVCLAQFTPILLFSTLLLSTRQPTSPPRSPNSPEV